MKRTPLAIVMSLFLLVPMSASFAQDKSQEDKNLMRNLGILLGAVAVDNALKGKHNNALLFGVGAAYAGKKYEDQRKAQKTWRSYRSKNGKRVGYWIMRGESRLRYVNLR